MLRVEAKLLHDACAPFVCCCLQVGGPAEASAGGGGSHHEKRELRFRGRGSARNIAELRRLLQAVLG